MKINNITVKPPKFEEGKKQRKICGQNCRRKIFADYNFFRKFFFAFSLLQILGVLPLYYLASKIKFFFHFLQNPTANNQKPTLLGDLHGLWALIDMQLDDIRSTFAAIEKFRLASWDACRVSSNIF